MEELKLQRGSSRGVQLAGAEVSEDSTQRNTEQIHQLCRAEDSLCFQNYFAWAVATGHTGKSVYMRISLN